MSDDKRQEDSDWLKDAFDRALRGDNGVAPDAARPAANPFGVSTPADQPSDDQPGHPGELDLDFETESTVPPQAFLPVVDFGDDAVADEKEPDPFAVFSMNEQTPTEALDVVDAPVTAPPAPVEVESETADEAPTSTDSIDGLASLFGDDKFTDATTAVIAPPARPAPTEATRVIPRADAPLKQAATATPRQAPANAVIYGVAAGVSVLLGIGGFVLGSALGGSTAAPEPTATEVAEATATREPGTWAWNQLFGGECIDPFPGAWAESFDVVDCATPHAAQLVAVGDLSELSGGVFPGVDQAATLTETACSAEGVLDLTLAGAYPNLQVSVAYAPTQEQWDAGETSYYCFVSLADATPITGSVAATPTDVTE